MKRDECDHTKNWLWVKCITTIRATRGIQWGKAQIRVLEGGQVHRKIVFAENDRYDYDKGEERNPKG
jgi:hypothetical protein